MSSKAILEYDAKLLLTYWLPRSPALGSVVGPNTVSEQPAVAQVVWDESSSSVSANLPNWVRTNPSFVAKPDQLIKRRGKAGLLSLNKDLAASLDWIKQRAGKDVQVEHTVGRLTSFILEPFLPHKQDDEYYVCVTSSRSCDTILFTTEGGVDVGDVDSKAKKLDIPIQIPLVFPERDVVKSTLLKNVPESRKEALCDFIVRLYSMYVDLHFAYLEINPLVVLENNGHLSVHPLDMAAKIDQTAESIVGMKWAIARDWSVYDVSATSASKGPDRGPPMTFPAPFGRLLTPAEAYIQKLDASTGASLKLTILNEAGRVWTMVAGGGASVVYSDAICGAGFAHELANYGEYSGAPTEGQTYEYAKTILALMTKAPHPSGQGKILIIGGGIANFTNVAATFKGGSFSVFLLAVLTFSKASSAHSKNSKSSSSNVKSKSTFVAVVQTGRKV